ncbi:relaxase (plasmid) [Rhizobium sp. ACO-34A]|nr:MobH family relaxase [Rhizobium sp. ACO-34A]ATN36783.1 relaxase [Rhizobium sp. ACO-34A]
MFTLLQRKRPSPATTALTMPEEKGKGLIRPEKSASLLATPRRQKLIEHIWQRTSLSRQQFAILYRGPLERYAELVQQFPASESHHHAFPGGMLDHGLEIVAYALKLRQSHLLPAGTTPEEQSEQSEAWTTAAAYAALLHDVGKIAVDLHVELADGSAWHPWHGPLRAPYRFRYRKDRDYRLHAAATGLLYNQVLDREILDWLSHYPSVWSSLLYVLAGQYEHAGTLGELVIQADRASVAQELGGDPARAMAAPKHALQRKLLEGLRYLLRQELKLNQPQASDGWLTEDTLWLVSKTVSDKLRAHLLSQGIEGIPSNNTAVFSVLQDHGIVQATPEGKAIWKAAVTGDQGWSHTFTLLRLSPALIWENGERPAAFSGSVEVVQEGEETMEQAPATTSGSQLSTNAAVQTAPENLTPIQHPPSKDDAVSALLDMFDSPETETPILPPVDFGNPTQPTAAEPPVKKALPVQPEPSRDFSQAEPSGEHFMAWLRQRIESRKLIINDAKALVHTVDDTAYLVSPGLFQRYAQEHLKVGQLARADKVADWQWVQKRFEKLSLHRKQPSGLNIWVCEVTGPRKSRRLHGYLLNDPHRIFDEVPPNNPYLSFPA